MQNTGFQSVAYTGKELEQILGVNPWKSEWLFVKILLGLIGAVALCHYMEWMTAGLILLLACYLVPIIMIAHFIVLIGILKHYYATKRRLVSGEIEPGFYFRPRVLSNDYLIANREQDLLVVNGEMLPLSSLKAMNGKRRKADFTVTLKFRDGDEPIKYIRMLNNKAEAEYQRFLNYLGWK